MDADVKMYLEWIDDRIRFRTHPNESLAQLDNEELSDFRELNPKDIWTPEISIINRHRDSTFKVLYTCIICIQNSILILIRIWNNTYRSTSSLVLLFGIDCFVSDQPLILRHPTTRTTFKQFIGIFELKHSK